MSEFWDFVKTNPEYIPDPEVQVFIESLMEGKLVETVNLKKLNNPYDAYICIYWHTARSVLGFVSPTLKWAREMKKVIGDKTVLEVAAGTGLVAKFLDSVGVKITATDNFSWYDDEHIGATWQPYFDVKKLDFKDAIKKYKADYLLLCWPFMNSLAREAAELFTKLNPNGLIIYIGEMGGCTADEEFEQGIEVIDSLENVNAVYPQWSGLWDQVYLAKWAGKSQNEA